MADVAAGTDGFKVSKSKASTSDPSPEDAAATEGQASSAPTPGTATPQPPSSSTAPSPSSSSPASERKPLAERVAEGVFVRLEHVTMAVAKFAKEHPGLDEIFVKGLLTELSALEATGAPATAVAVLGALDEAPKK